MNENKKHPAELPTREIIKELHEILHTLWTKAVGTENYDKKEWGRFDQLIQVAKERMKEI